MTKAADSSKKKSNKNKPVKGSHYTPPNSSKELPKSYYQRIKREKGSDIPYL